MWIIDKFGNRRKLRDGEILPDGARLCAPMIRFGDGSSVRDATFDIGARQPVADALAGHRPGCHIADTAAQDRAHGAYLARKALLANAWRAVQ
jgi:hypothetical protein